MFTLKRLIGGSLFVFVLATTALAQEKRAPIETPREPAAPMASAPLVTATATAKRVRFVSPGTVVQLRLEVYNETGQKLFDTELRGGNVLDWHLQDGAGQRLAAGSYACVLTTKSLSGRLSQRVGRVTVNDQQAMVEGGSQLSVAQQQTIGPVEGSAAFTVVQEMEAEAITAVTHDGNDGRITSTRGALTFGTGDVFAGNEVERMRITPEGNVGIGTDKPEAKLDVVGDIRSTGVLRLDKGIEFADGTLQTTGLSGRKDSEGNLVPNVAGTGTQGRLAKWTDNAGTLGNSVVTEAASGKLGIGTVSPNYEITLFGNDVGLQLISSASGTTANDGFRFGVSSTNNAFLWNTEATDMYFGTTATERMRIKAAGNVGIGTTDPGAKLDVAGNINTTTQYNIGGNRVLSNGGSNNLFAGVGAGTLTTGSSNSFFGAQTGVANTTGSSNSFFGVEAGDLNTTGSGNSFFGVEAGEINTEGFSNSFFGVEAGGLNTTGNANSFFGVEAGQSNTTENNNTFVGYNSNGAAGITNATAIGYLAKVTQSNSLVLGSINGQNGATADTNVGIGTTAPKAKLHVVGGNIYIAQPNSLVITSPNGNCWFITVSDTGVLSSNLLTCP